MTTDASVADQPEYRVLARKYRPDSFETLIGQDAMVRTLSNAIETNRLAHAFVMTGVRGVGKTTTARIIAKALNCQTSDGPTINPCGTCDACVGIAESRHVDVLEMDAASRTGVGDVREIIDSVRYAPVSARFKIYIIDEVHMLSTAAFNALLKTLEEPPEHVKFIFATTEIRKIPVTVLSRCQRFDLKRVESDALVGHLDRITRSEGAEAEEGALKLIARAAEGSVRDSLSLLDQAIAHGGQKVSEQQVRDMLGLADRAMVLDLFELVMAGKTAEALAALRKQYDRGADPSVVVGDMLEVTHWLTRLKVAPDAGGDSVVSEAEKELGGKMAAKLAMPALTRAWQMLLKGLSEVRVAPSPIAAAEMILIRLCHAADMPSPADLVKKLTAGGAMPGGSVSGGAGGRAGTAAPSASVAGHSAANQGYANTGAPYAASGGAQIMSLRKDQYAGDMPKHPMPVTYEKLIELFRAEKEVVLAVQLSDKARLIDFAPGKIIINPGKDMAPDTPSRVKRCLRAWTGNDWTVTLQKTGGQATVREQQVAKEAAILADAKKHPKIKAFLSVFDGANIVAVREKKDEMMLSEMVTAEAIDDSGDVAVLDMSDMDDFNY